MITILLLLFTASLLALKLIPTPSHHTANIFRATSLSKARLSFTPSRLSALDITLLVILVIYKYTTKLLNLHTPCKISKTGKDFALPGLALSAPLYVTNTDLENFALAVDQKRDRHLDDGDCEGNSPLLLAAVTTPLLLILLSNRHCPVFPFGAVNTKNRFEFLDPAACRSVTSLKDANVISHFGGDELPGRRVKRGMEFDIVVEIESLMINLGKAERKIIFRQVIGILVALPTSAQPIWENEAAISTMKEDSAREWKVVEHVQLSLTAPSKWARVCKDVNPIHMNSLAARLFGFPGKIAHGNHVAALVVETQRKNEASLFWQTQKRWFLEVQFKRPMVLPLDLQVGMSDEEEKRRGRFEVVRGEKAYVTGDYGEL
ncbi:hypothetical protein EG328_005623 [Venturia inaequalis]|uniref:MaoC-like domain-containing protein n=1 Tax=Venturia inaequalis TaxID=5025 RepID=A0A8H3ZAA0_VENIN|nr:hypothetical protein EG328_005623 [Venturia inaequalis]